MSGTHACDLVVVGGGLVGACLAEELATREADVIVLDARGEPGHATGKAAGVAVPSLRYLLDEAFYGWLSRGQAALEHDLARLEPANGVFSLTQPVMRLLTAGDVAALPAHRLTASIGRPAEETEVAALAPGLRIPEDRQPYLVERGLTVRGISYLQAVRRAAIGAGARWLQERKVTQIREGESGVEVTCTDGTQVTADRAVVTAGAWTGKLVDVPVVPQRGQLVLLDATRSQLDCIVSGRHYLAPLPGGGLLVGATEEDAGFDESSTAGSVAGLLAFALRLLPGLASATVLENRSGLRPVTPTGYPVTGRAPGQRRVYVAAGHAGHGLISARLTAQGMAAGLEGGDWTGLPEEFCPRSPAPAPATATATAPATATAVESVTAGR
jgi:glycine oxidase